LPLLKFQPSYKRGSLADRIWR